MLLAVLFVPVLGCDKATPVAPEGTILTVSASPSKIGPNGASTITVVGRKPNGSALNPGTEIRFSTTLGSVTPPVAETQDGVATATLIADGRIGAAEVTVAAASTTAKVSVQIGETDTTKPTLLVSVSPSTVPVEGQATITVIARGSDGSLLGAGHEIILTTTLGSLSPSRPTTRSDGTATATLRAGKEAGTATVTAILGSSAAATATVTIRDAATDIAIQANPATVSRSATTTEIILSAFVTNSLGQPLNGAPVTFFSEVGTLEDTNVEFTDSTGRAEKKLTVRSQDLPAAPPVSTTFTVRATTPGGTGTLIEDEETIRVNG